MNPTSFRFGPFEVRIRSRGLQPGQIVQAARERFLIQDAISNVECNKMLTEILQRKPGQNVRALGLSTRSLEPLGSHVS